MQLFDYRRVFELSLLVVLEKLFDVHDGTVYLTVSMQRMLLTENRKGKIDQKSLLLTSKSSGLLGDENLAEE